MKAKKEILVLYSRRSYPGQGNLYKEHVNILNSAVSEKDGVIFYQGFLSELVFELHNSNLKVTEPKIGRDIRDFDLVFFQKWMVLPEHAHAAAIYLRHSHTDFISSEVLKQNPFSKLSEMILLSLHELPYPRTIVANVGRFLDIVETETMFVRPFIVKPLVGSRGIGTQLLTSRSQFKEMLVKLEDREGSLMVQEFMDNDYDYRIGIIGGVVVYVIKRIHAKDSFLNNISQGAKGHFVDINSLPKQIIIDAVAAARAVGRTDFAGVDMLVDKHNKHWILEVNKSPEIQTGFNPSKKTQLLVKYLSDRLNGHKI